MKAILVLIGAVVHVSITVAQSPATFTVTGNMSVPRVGHTATLLLNGKVLICGGADRADSLGTVLDSAELYDPITETFAPAGNMTSPRWHHSATLLPDGRVLIAGGTINPNAGGASNSVMSSSEIYDP